MGWGWSHAIALGVTAAAALAVSEVYAGGCPPAATAYPAASYATQAAYYPVAATTYYSAPVKTVYVDRIKTVKVKDAPDFYSSTADYYRDKILVDAIAGKTAETLQLQQRLQQMEQSLQQQQSFQAQQAQWMWQQQQQAQPPQQAPFMPPANGYGYGQPPAGQQWHPQQQRHPDVPEGLGHLLHQRCTSCHGDAAARRGGGLDLRQPWAVDYETRLACLSECAVGNMPKSAHRLTQDELSLLYQWAQMGRQAARR